MDDLREALARRLKEDSVPDYRVRVIIRFWLSTDPPLIEKVGTAYRAAEPAKFRHQSRDAFDSLPSRPRR